MNDRGQLGTDEVDFSTAINASVPVVDGVVTSVSAGLNHTCSITKAGQVEIFEFEPFHYLTYHFRHFVGAPIHLASWVGLLLRTHFQVLFVI